MDGTLGGVCGWVSGKMDSYGVGGNLAFATLFFCLDLHWPAAAAAAMHGYVSVAVPPFLTVRCFVHCLVICNTGCSIMQGTGLAVQETGRENNTHVVLRGMTCRDLEIGYCIYKAGANLRSL